MNPRDSLLDEALRRMDPLAEIGDAPGGQDPEELLALIVSTGPRQARRPAPLAARLWGPRGRRRLLAAAALAGILAIVALAGKPEGDEEGAHTLPVLARVAEAAAAQPTLGEDLPYLFLKTRTIGVSTAVTGGQAFSYSAPSIREAWIAEDGSGLIRIHEQPGRWASPKDRKLWEASGAPTLFSAESGKMTKVELPPGRSPNFLPGGTPLSDLPLDPSELAAWIEAQVTDPAAGAGAGNGFSVAVRSIALVSEILSNPLASPELRAALFEAEGQIPGIRDLGEVRDQQGRRGVAVGAESANSGAPTVYSMIFDPKTSMVLASQEEILEAPSALPDEGYPRTESTLYLQVGAASSPGARPRLWH